MDAELVNQWEANKGDLRGVLENTHLDEVDSYSKIMALLVRECFWEFSWNKVVTIDHGMYSGAMLFLVPEDCYQPDKYILTHVSYGSCSVCDTLQGIIDYGEGLPTKEQVDQLMVLCLHLVQRAQIVECD